MGIVEKKMETSIILGYIGIIGYILGYNMSYSLNSLKGGFMGDYYRGY